MKAIFLAVSLLFTAQFLFGQGDNASLLVQSPDGRKVMLVWFLKTWSPDITGFDIKRKEGLQDWVKLNSEPIIPGISMKKKLSIVEADKSEVARLKANLYKLLATRKLKETENAAYLQQLANDEKTLRELCDKMAQDYDFALMNGFAYVDHSVRKKTNYEYGLFAEGTGRLLARALWNYGEIPDLNTIHEITSRATTKTKGVQLMWDADAKKMKDGCVAGFNIYRQGIRLNDDPVLITDSKDPGVFVWSDKSANSAEMQQYSISAESIFGVEGIIKPYTYNPADHPAEYRKPQVSEVTAMGYYLRDGINVKWNFPKEDERFLKGFYVEKDNMPAGYKRVSTLLDPSVRSYNDKTNSPVSSYIRFRIVAVYTDRTNEKGADRLYSYFPVNEPPAPQNLKLKLEANGHKNTVQLTWDAPMSGDVMTDYYRVYALKPGNANYLITAGDRRITSNNYSYAVNESQPGEYRFYVTAVGKSGSEGVPGDTVAVRVELPVPMNLKLTADTAKVTVQWQYPDVRDIKGFRLLRDNNVVVNEDILKGGLREYIMPRPEPGNYHYTMVAVSESGVVSLSSKTVSLSIAAPAASGK